MKAYRTADPKTEKPRPPRLWPPWLLVALCVAATGQLHDMDVGHGKQTSAVALTILAIMWASVVTIVRWPE